MKWQNIIATWALALILIVKVTDYTVVFQDGSQLTIAGAKPHVGEAEVYYHGCSWWTMWMVCEATVVQDGISYEAVQ